MGQDNERENKMTTLPTYYEAASTIFDAKSALNSSSSGYSAFFFTTDPIEAKESIETTRRLIKEREFELEIAREALAVYEAEVENNGPRKYGEFNAEQARLLAEKVTA